MRTSTFILSILLLLNSPKSVLAQTTNKSTETSTANDQDETDELSKMLDEELAETKKVEYATATFKTTRLINGHSIENVGRGVLDFKISHRFNRIDKGVSDFFGLDGATMRLGLDYGLSDRIMIGVGRNSNDKEYDGFVKAKIVRQHDAMPISISYIGSAMIQTMAANVLPTEKYYLSNRLCYSNQLLIARKFSNAFSLQLMPSLVHYNLVDTKQEGNNLIAMGVGGRLKMSKRISLNVEYYYQLPDYQKSGTSNSLAIGFDIETGGHVFQLHFTNSTGMTERTFIGRSTDKWTDGGIRFGFNISRVFTVVKPKAFKTTESETE